MTVQQLRELEAACERERGGMQELLAKHEAVCRCDVPCVTCDVRCVTFNAQ